MIFGRVLELWRGDGEAHHMQLENFACLDDQREEVILGRGEVTTRHVEGREDVQRGDRQC